MPDSLPRLEEILGRYGCAHQAQYVGRLRLLYEEDRDRFRDEVDDREMWGGAGSVVDCVPLGGVHRDRQPAEADEQRFLRLIVQLVDELEEEGLVTARAIEVANAFRPLINRE